MIQVNRIYLIFNRLVTKKFLVDTSVFKKISRGIKVKKEQNFNMLNIRRTLLKFNRLI